MFNFNDLNVNKPRAVSNNCPGQHRCRMRCFADSTLADTVADTKSGHGTLALKDGTLGLLYDLTGLELSDDLIASGKRDTVSWKNPNLVEDGKE